MWVWADYKKWRAYEKEEEECRGVSQIQFPFVSWIAWAVVGFVMVIVGWIGAVRNLL